MANTVTAQLVDNAFSVITGAIGTNTTSIVSGGGAATAAIAIGTPPTAAQLSTASLEVYFDEVDGGTDFNCYEVTMIVTYTHPACGPRGRGRNRCRNQPHRDS